MVQYIPAQEAHEAISFDRLTRRELQSLAKLNGIAANQKSSDIVKCLTLRLSPSAKKSPYDGSSSSPGETETRAISTVVTVEPLSLTPTLNHSAAASGMSAALKSEVSSAERRITQEIKRLDGQLREQYPLLAYQSSIGVAIFISSVLLTVLCWHYYYQYRGDLYVTGALVLIVGFAASILHELEHDLIHNLYFPKHRWVQDLMFLVIWMAKFNANPWWRRTMHLKHHVVSGQPSDAEERIIGLGMPMGLSRMAVTMHPYGALLVSREVAKSSPFLNLFEMIFTTSPVFGTSAVLNKVFAVYLFCNYFGLCQPYIALVPDWAIALLVDFHVMLFLPNVIRQSSLVLMSNSSHYYGDIPEKSVFFQNQIIDHWAVIPFQLLCVNFGATHVLHHYVPGQPFYLRQMIYDAGAKEFLVREGVRLNDFGSLNRSNRYFQSEKSKSEDLKKNVAALSGDIERTTWLSVKMALFVLMCYTLGLVTFIFYDVLVLAEVPLNLYVQFTNRGKKADRDTEHDHEVKR